MKLPVTTFSVQAWAGWCASSEDLNLGKLAPILRRRVTPLGRNALSVACALPQLDKVRYVFSSRHGEFERTLSVLNSIAAGEALSPADFSLSVHHALIGLLSIHALNKAGHTAVAGGDESFCCGLLEALACLVENPDEPVLLLHCDEPLPEAYAVFSQPEEKPVALALLLGAGGDVFSLEAEPRGDPSVAPTLIAEDFLSFLQGEALHADSFSRKHHWIWGRHGAG